MLSQARIEAWLADESGMEIKHGPVTQPSDKDATAMVYIEPGKVCTISIRFCLAIAC